MANTLLLAGFLLVAGLCDTVTTVHAQQQPEFDPYQLNGGLVAAVAGRDYCAIACDTRLSAGYGILQRNHVASRLWTATPVALPKTTVSAATTTTRTDHGSAAPTTAASSGRRAVSWSSHPRSLSPPPPSLPVFIASAGCNADCEALKRCVRADWRAAAHFGECSSFGTSADQVAALLSQMLYSRRGFPFYSFCVVAGLDAADDDDDDDHQERPGIGGGGRVFGFDAVGSYERVAVATGGMGRDLLQPILDRNFRTLMAREQELDSSEMADDSDHYDSSLQGTSDSSPHRPVSSAITDALVAKFRTPLSMQVSCSKEEAVTILRDAYRAVSEREIGVGDQVVIWTLQRRPSNDNGGNGGHEWQVIRFPLKKH